MVTRSQLIGALRKALSILERPSWAASGIDLPPVSTDITEVREVLNAAEVPNG
jgi:hypothetical protein